MIFKRRLASGAAITALAFGLSVAAAHAQETTGSIRGQVTNESGAPVAGATVVITHKPTGTRATTVTGDDGFYSVRSLRVGGPYTINVNVGGRDAGTRTINAIGVGDPTEGDVIALTETTVSEVVVQGSAPTPPGLGSSFGQNDVNTLPSISRDLKDVARVDPFASIDPTNQDALSFVGTNNRFNQLSVDGIRQNDDFGLNNNGYPTQRSPISIDAVQALQVSIAPYSVVNNGFLGGSINAVTKSGTNVFSGSAYIEYSDYHWRNDEVQTWDTSTTSGTGGSRIFRDVTSRFVERNWGVTLGGPIIQDTLFFFVSYDHYAGGFFLDEGPADSGRATIIPRITTASINTFQAGTQATYGVDPGNWVQTTPPIVDVKWMAKIDWNITDDQRLAITYQNTHGQSFNGSTSDLFAGGDSTTQPRIGLSSYQYLKDEQLTTWTGQLNSTWTPNFTTELRLGNKHTIQNRIALGSDLTIGEVTVNVADLPGVAAGSGTPQIRFGNEINSQPNFLDITVNTAELIARYQMGDHEFLFGARTERQDILNIFGRNYLPNYSFTSYANFLARNADPLASGGNCSTSAFCITGAVNPTGGTVAATPGTAAAGAAAFKYALNSVYAEDTWQASENITVLFGVRYDWFTMSDVPVNNPTFMTRNGFSNQQNLDGKGIVLPRLYVTWKPADRWDVSAGVGRFSNQGLNVWISNPFANDGQRVVNAVCPTNSFTNVNLHNVPAGCTFTPGNGNTNVLDPNLKIASVWKATLSVAYNFDLGSFWGDDWRVALDVINQQNENSLYWRDLRSVQIGVAPDGRPVWGRTNVGTIGANVFDMQLGNLKNGGYSRSAAISVSHRWTDGIAEGLSMNASYTYTRATDRNPMTSSIADSSYVRFASFNHQNPSEATSDYEIRNKFQMNFTYERNFFFDLPTTLNVFVQSRSGMPFSYTFDSSRSGSFDNDFGNVVTQSYSGRQAQSNQLLYVPATDSNGNVTLTSDPRVNYSGTLNSATAVAAFNDFLHQTGLISYSGRIAPRNAFRTPSVTTVDLRLSQELPGIFPNSARILAYIDIENFGNLLNKRWGLLEQYDFYRGVPTVTMNCTGGAAAQPAPAQPNPIIPANTCAGATAYTYSALRTQPNNAPTRPFPFINSSLWQVKFGLKYRF